MESKEYNSNFKEICSFYEEYQRNPNKPCFVKSFYSDQIYIKPYYTKEIKISTKYYGSRKDFSLIDNNFALSLYSFRPCTYKSCNKVEKSVEEFILCSKCNTVFCSEECIKQDHLKTLHNDLC